MSNWESRAVCNRCLKHYDAPHGIIFFSDIASNGCCPNCGNDIDNFHIEVMRLIGPRLYFIGIRPKIKAAHWRKYDDK